jgi:hypothetical protein
MADLFSIFMVLMVGLFEGWNPDDIGTTAWCGFSSIPTSNLMRHLRSRTYYGCLYFGESPVDEIERGIQNPKHYNDPGVIFVEDPFDKSQSTARALTIMHPNESISTIEGPGFFSRYASIHATTSSTREMHCTTVTLSSIS